MRKESFVRWERVVAALFVAIAASAGYAEEKPWSRAYRGELYPIVQMLGGDTVTTFNGVRQLETDDTPVFGAGMGLNLNDHLNINTEFLLGSMGSAQGPAHIPDSAEDLNVGVWLWNLNLDYNILKSRLTPLVTGGFGLFRVHEGSEHISETHWSYNVGAGGRWDITNSIALRVIYRLTWTRFENTDDPFQFDGVTANLIFMFK